MERRTIDRPGLIIFLAGVGLVLASTALGFYLASRVPETMTIPDWHLSSYDSEMAKIGRTYALLWDVQVQMWLCFTLGTCLTLFGLRMLTKPRLDIQPSPPLGAIGNVFKNPD